MQQLRFFFSALALLYMFRATISHIIRSTYAVYGNCCILLDLFHYYNAIVAACWTYFTTITQFLHLVGLISLL